MALIAKQKTVIAAYQNYYEESEQALDAANQNIEDAQAEVEAQNNQPTESVLGNLNPFKENKYIVNREGYYVGYD